MKFSIYVQFSVIEIAKEQSKDKFWSEVISWVEKGQLQDFDWFMVVSPSFPQGVRVSIDIGYRDKQNLNRVI